MCAASISVVCKKALRCFNSAGFVSWPIPARRQSAIADGVPFVGEAAWFAHFHSPAERCQVAHTIDGFQALESFLQQRLVYQLPGDHIVHLLQPLDLCPVEFQQWFEILYQPGMVLQQGPEISLAMQLFRLIGNAPLDQQTSCLVIPTRARTSKARSRK